MKNTAGNFSSGRVGLHLSQTFLSSPHRGVNDLQEELSGSGVEDENGSIDGLRGQVTLKGLMREMKNTCDYIHGLSVSISSCKSSI